MAFVVTNDHTGHFREVGVNGRVLVCTAKLLRNHSNQLSMAVVPWGDVHSQSSFDILRERYGPPQCRLAVEGGFQRLFIPMRGLNLLGYRLPLGVITPADHRNWHILERWRRGLHQILKAELLHHGNKKTAFWTMVPYEHAKFSGNLLVSVILPRKLATRIPQEVEVRLAFCETLLASLGDAGLTSHGLLVGIEMWRAYYLRVRW